uniref:Uncharacterized protein n=1 Tax=Eutreptiella gymnastica TaxID=73025 RepID=A0A7S4CZQ1_9EUGL
MLTIGMRPWSPRCSRSDHMHTKWVGWAVQVTAMGVDIVEIWPSGGRAVQACGRESRCLHDARTQVVIQLARHRCRCVPGLMYTVLLKRMEEGVPEGQKGANRVRRLTDGSWRWTDGD